MSKDISKKLLSYRQKIDQIDKDIHRLLMARAHVVNAIGKAKKSAKATFLIQPERERQVLKNLTKRHRGKFPLVSLQCIWREIMSASLFMQKPFSVGYLHDAKGEAYTLARQTFGASIHPKKFIQTADLIKAIGAVKLTYGILPASKNKNLPVVARLPIGSKGSAAKIVLVTSENK